MAVGERSERSPWLLGSFPQTIPPRRLTEPPLFSFRERPSYVKRGFVAVTVRKAELYDTKCM